MSNLKYQYILLALCLLKSISSSSSHTTSNDIHPSPKQNCIKKVFAFGDSFTDTGNARLLGNLSAYASALFPGSPLGSTFFQSPKKRFSDGRLVIDFLMERLEIPRIQVYMNYTANFTYGANFAVSGSTALSVNVAAKYKQGRASTWQPLPEYIQTQMDWFSKFIANAYGSGNDESKEYDFERSLFWIGEFGASDYIKAFGKALLAPSQSLTEIAVDNVCTLLKNILDKGAKQVVVQGLPPSGCFPLELWLAPAQDRDDKGCARTANSIIIAHNNLLQAKIEEIRKQYTQSTILYADYWGAYYEIISNPKKYGFDEPFKACCGGGGGYFNFDVRYLCGTLLATQCPDPNKYISWDGIHLTDAMSGKMADLFFSGGFCKPSFDEFIRTCR
ncbi:hypothetical protein ACHQM5_015982 [Ranunculus cassubicifolius]